MKNRKTFSARRTLADESGQIVPWMAVLLMLLFAGLCTLVIDVGRCVVANHMLQAATDAAVLAGVQVMPTATSDSQVTTQANLFSAVPGDKNANDYWLPGATMVSGFPRMYCSSTVTGWGVACNPSINLSGGGANALVVQQTVTVPLYFGSLIGYPTMTITATSTASMNGSQNAPYNIAMVIDTTGSMSSPDTDASCGSTRIKCALQGLQTMLSSLSPCTTSSTSSSCTSFDRVSLFTYPNVKASTVSSDTDCSSGTSPTISNYYTPVPGATWSAPTGASATYQITTFSSDWSSTNQKGGSFNSSSALATASGGVSGCTGLQAKGGVGTYYAGAIYAAQSALMAQQAANPGSQNALVILSDGDANSEAKITTSGTVHTAGSTATVNSSSFTYNVAYPSAKLDLCQQAIDAATYAKLQGTEVYTISYGAANSGCDTDTSGSHKGLSPCSALQLMATSAADFYSDAKSSQNPGACISSLHPNLTLNQIFKTLVASFTKARLIPNGTA